MKIKIIIFICLIFLSINCVYATDYAILISAGKATLDDEGGNSEYWYDLFLAYEDLVLNQGLSHSNIYVCYGDGQSFSSSISRYNLNYHSWTNIVDYNNTYSSIETTFTTVGNLSTNNDNIIIRWVLGHGLNDYTGEEEEDGYAALIENRNYYISELEIIDYIDEITDYKSKIIVWCTCFAGCLVTGDFKIDSEDTWVVTSADWDEETRSVDMDYYHAEFNWWLTGYLYGEAPCSSGSQSLDADDNNDTYISLKELAENTEASYSFSTMQEAGYSSLREFSKITGLLPMTNAGQLSHNELWYGNHTITNNITVPTDYTLHIDESTILNLSTHNISSSGGTITVDDGADINPSYIAITEGGVLKGLYPSLSSAFSATTTGQIVELHDSYTFSSNYTVPPSETLKIKSDANITINSPYTIDNGSGTLLIDNRANISPDIRAITSGSIEGLYQSISSAMSQGFTVQARGGIHTFADNYTISSSKGLSLYDKAEIKFPSGKYLNVEGGLSCDDVSFTSTSGTWGGIKYKENSTGTLDEATITNATYGVYCNEASPTIMYSDISNCTYGIYNNDASPTISHNDISGSTYDISCYDSSPIIRNNDISGGTISLYCDHYSSPELLTGGNYFHNNSYVTFGVFTDDNSRPNLGNSDCCLPGNNSFVYSMYDIAIVHSGVNCSTIFAQGNWWGAYPVPTGIFSGSVDWSNPLTSAPSFSPLAPNPENDLFDQNLSFASIAPNNGGVELINFYDNKWPLNLKIDFLTYLYYKGEAIGISTLCMDIIEENPDTPQAFSALGLMYQIAKKEGISKDFDKQLMKNYLKTFENKKGNKEFIGSALLMLAGLEDEEGLTRIDEVIKDHKGSYVAKYGLYQKFMYYYHDAEDMKKAEEVLVLLDSEYPDDRVTFEAHLLMGDNEVESKAFYAQYSNKETPNIDYVTTDIQKIIPEKYTLSAAYPNPFNPSTTLEYALPVQSKVECAIYSISGELVKSFNFDQNAGTHSIVWDGSNVSSGIYLIRFVAEAEDGTNSFVEYMKVTLLK